MAGWCCKKFDVGAKVVSPFPADVAAMSATSWGRSDMPETPCSSASCCDPPGSLVSPAWDARLNGHTVPQLQVPDTWPNLYHSASGLMACRASSLSAENQHSSLLLCPANTDAAGCEPCQIPAMHTPRQRLDGGRLTNDHGLPDNEVSNPPTPPVCSTAHVSQQQYASTRVARVQTACCWVALHTQR